MVVGSLPYFSGNWDEMLKKRIQGHPLPFPDRITPECKDFIMKLLIVDPSKRLVGPAVLEHPWLANHITDWRVVYSKQLDPPIKPLTVETNFSPDFTCKLLPKLCPPVPSDKSPFAGWPARFF
jgi:serine/threonine protein kinase